MPLRRRLLLALLLLLLLIAAAIVPGRIHLDRQRTRLASVLSAELGRQVTLGAVSLRLLPRPGFDIRNGFSVADDPAFGAEPLLRADQVAADLRLGSLWSGRIEIAQIKLTGASINLVRRPDHHWNIEALLLRASQIPSAPTPQRHAESRPRFPYIEAVDSRVNLKFGLEKSPYSLTEADFSGWLENDDRWNLRLEARPMRTDLPISDTGAIQISARAGRASRLGDTPIEATLNLQQAQLGDLTKLVLGHDLAWRGSVETQLTAHGPLKRLQLAWTARIREFRRYDVASDTAMELVAACSGALNYAPAGRSLDDVACNLPFGDGAAAIHGSLAFAAASPSFALTVQARDVPAEQLIRMFRNAQQFVAPDLTAAGSVNGEISIVRAAPAPLSIAGEAELSAFSLSSASLGAKLVSPAPVRLASAPKSAVSSSPRSALLTAAPENGIQLLPAVLTSLGELSGAFSSDGWRLQLDGDFDVPYALNIGRALGFSVPFAVSRGHASGPLVLAGTWTGFQHYALTSDFALRGIVAGTGAHELHIDSANLRLTPSSAQLYDMHAGFPAAPLAFDGNVSVARPCSNARECTYTADLHTASLDISKLRPLFTDPSGLLGSLFDRGSWFDHHHQLLSNINASGTLRVDHLLARAIAADALSTAFSLRDGVLSLKSLSASAYSGRIAAANLRADLTSTPSYLLSAELQRINLASALSALGSTGMTGVADGTLTLRMEGGARSALAASAAGNARLAVAKGSLATDTDAFRFRRLNADLTLANRQITLANATATQPAGKPWSVAGAISFDRRIALTFRRSDGETRQLSGKWLAAPSPTGTPVALPLTRASK